MALWVFASHLVAIAWQPVSALPSPWNTLLNGGYGVDVFIILSGFVITHLIQTKPESYGHYLWRRFCRLYPLFFFAVSLALVGVHMGFMPMHFDESKISTHYAVHLTMLHGLVPNDWLQNAQGSLLTPAWSVSLEWQFYLVAPFALALAGRSVRFAVALGVLCLLAHRFVPGWLGSHYSYAGFLPLKLGYFFLGAVSWFGTQALLAIPNLKTRLLWYGMGAAPLLFTLSFSHYFGVLVWLVALGFLLLGEDRPATRLLNAKPLLLLGTWSYSIYLLHEIIIHATLFLWPDLGGGDGVPRLLWLSAISVPATLLFSALAYHLIEKPGMALGRRLDPRLPAPAPPSAHA
jgi:peptidoglycan/LPS O-acetylase OafA/YrhL